ncbi:hypothetical protein CC78DRAFT_503804 [Lojkania enalia]|uniref:Uncharacterized protein n=1 Tax=Lojkania enalia TaxID=147567 RepID=A0A9P4K2M5_9PLEO|nr:hypothetical protein CC78DRAFT_503804 [Didymosphaeria enalia]
MSRTPDSMENDRHKFSTNDDEPIYLRNEIISAVTAFYKLLVRLYLPNDAIKYPPPNGWFWPADITFAPPKSPAVIDLMKHMPYLQRPAYWDSLQIYEKTEAVDYSSFNTAGPHDIDPDPSLTTLPSHALLIGYARGRNGHYVFVDTERGTFTLCDFQVGPREQTYLSEDLEDVENPVVRLDRFGDECTEHWREYATYTTSEFFEKLTREFTELELIPHPNGEVHFANGARSVSSGENRLRDIFVDHGWPAKKYRKEDCMNRVGEFDKSLGM